ncbi:VOC family protein [Mucilaginibacter lacusdianchii]|uniref:VOC family protein n=1 Tax=Mucilaginibacter lacusdianchii TaxID=2684211 RepID=UPI00131E5245|nr:VOC family protein [Mucilaginibacter sp. JXJ CY 39]
MTQINAYLTFNGNCREALSFYQQCLGGHLEMLPVGQSPMAQQCPTAVHDQIMHACLIKDALWLMASDMVMPGSLTVGNNFALSLNCSSEEEINQFYSSLSAGGQIIDELKMQFWGALFGVFTDKFGIRWMLSYDKNKQ